ncbi:hypothetical protein JCM10212_003152 [Sporobolomyces blumeae]
MQSAHAAIVSALKKAELWGTIVPPQLSESVPVQLEFPKAKVELGNAIEVADAQAEPKVGFVSDDPIKDPQDAHLLLVIDPDAPTRPDPKWGPFLHFIQPGLKPRSVDEIEALHADKTSRSGADDGEDAGIWASNEGTKSLVEWLGPAPPEGSGPHRYVYLLYRQPNSEVKLPKSSPQGGIKDMEDRKQFDFESFVEINQLELVGVNFHTSEKK